MTTGPALTDVLTRPGESIRAYVQLHAGQPGESCRSNPSPNPRVQVALLGEVSGSLTAINDATWDALLASETLTHLSIWTEPGMQEGELLRGPIEFFTPLEVTEGDSLTLPSGAGSPTLGFVDVDGNVYSILFDPNNELLGLQCIDGDDGSVTQLAVNGGGWTASVVNSDGDQLSSFSTFEGHIQITATDPDSNNSAQVELDAGVFSAHVQSGDETQNHTFQAAIDGSGFSFDGVTVDPTGGNEGDVMTVQGDGSIKPQTPA